MIVTPITTRIFRENEDLFAFIADYIKSLSEQSVVVVTSKIVALAEGRTALLNSATDKEKTIRTESEHVIRTKHVWLTVKEGFPMTAAGVDESNADGKLILLPKDSFKIAQRVRNKLRKKYAVKDAGVLIVDSRTTPFRAGITGVALGYAGFRGIKDYCGTKDIFGRTFKFSRTNVADCLASAAVLAMGEGAEQQPLAVIKNAPVAFCNTVRRKELYIDIKDDMYRPLFEKLPRR